MRLIRNLLWVDGLAAAVAGVAILLLRYWLSDWYRLPLDLLTFGGVVNLIYASYSLSLAKRPRRPKNLIVLLAVANFVWAMFCLRWAVVFVGTASLFGIAHFVLEALFVGGLAALEWRFRERLQTA